MLIQSKHAGLCLSVSKGYFIYYTLFQAQLPLSLPCYDLPHLSSRATGGLYTNRIARFRALTLKTLTSKSALEGPVRCLLSCLF